MIEKPGFEDWNYFIQIMIDDEKPAFRREFLFVMAFAGVDNDLVFINLVN